MKDVALSFRIPADVKTELQRRADLDQRSVSQIVLLALQHYIDTVPAPEPRRKAKSRS